MKKHHFAHTNIQLFNQLANAGYSNSDLFYLFDVYKFATDLFAGFQASGKAFITHFIRTASILVDMQAEVPVIAAGLIHSAYEYGDFGDGSRGISEWKRTQVRRKVTETTELHIAIYTALQWNDSSISAVYSNLIELSSIDRNVLLIRLANELEQSLDLEVLYRSDVEKKIEWIKRKGNLMIEMAVAIGYPALADELAQAFQDIMSPSASIACLRDSEYFSHISGRLSLKHLLWLRFRSLFKRVRLNFIVHRSKNGCVDGNAHYQELKTIGAEAVTSKIMALTDSDIRQKLT